jgi:hypothetical protein
MNDSSLLIELRSLEAHLAMVQARIKKSRKSQRAFADLYGILKGISETTEQEIEAIKFKAKVEPA